MQRFASGLHDRRDQWGRALRWRSETGEGIDSGRTLIFLPDVRESPHCPDMLQSGSGTWTMSMWDIVRLSTLSGQGMDKCTLDHSLERASPGAEIMQIAR